MNFETEPFGDLVAANGRNGARDYILDMTRSLSRLARRSREDDLAILLEAVAAATAARERVRRR